MPEAPPPPRPAATVLVLRDAADGPQVLMLRRHARSGFAGDAWVFPGGTVDAADRVLPADRWQGIDPAALAERFAVPPELVLGFHVAAVRETFEEAGILLGRHADGRAPAVGTPTARRARSALADRADPLGWQAWLAAEDLVCNLGGLTYLSRWVTPLQEPRRYDTAFFLAPAPVGQVAAHDAVETTGQRWTTPRAALAAHRDGVLHLIYPTIRTLEALEAVPTVADALATAAAQPAVRSLRPHIEHGPDGVRILHPDDPAYPRAADGGVPR